jgi:hypothetical protein
VGVSALCLSLHTDTSNIHRKQVIMIKAIDFVSYYHLPRTRHVPAIEIFYIIVQRWPININRLMFWMILALFRGPTPLFSLTS